MKVIPVIDVLNGIVVHAVRGKRREYQPLQTIICKSVDPLEVAKSFKIVGFSELYVADLDAITGGQANLDLFNRIAHETGLKLMVDAGISEIKTAEKVLDSQISKVIVGTETLSTKSFIAEAIRLFGSERIVVSLDLKGDEVMVSSGFDGCLNPMCLLHEFEDMGVSQVIVLDLARVGSGEGVNVAFLKKVIDDLAVDIYVGGGVRDVKDLIELKSLGVSGVLVATALHSGKIIVEDLKQADLI